jgi:hypothetical protein
MIATYKRASRTAFDLNLGDWTPLDVAVGFSKHPTLQVGIAHSQTLSRKDGAG